MTTMAVEERNPSLKRTAKGRSGKNLIEYRGYVGRVVFDDEAGIFHGEVINLKDVIRIVRYNQERSIKVSTNPP